MTSSHLITTTLLHIPDIKILLLRAALKKSSYDPKKMFKALLPKKIFYFDGFELDESNYKLFHQVVDWKSESDFIHPCHLHSLAFPLHIMMLLLPEFPFPLLGLVHVSNQITQMRPIKNDDRLVISCCFGELVLHPKGWLFSIEVEFHSDNGLVWQSTSKYLFRTEHNYNVKPISIDGTGIFTSHINETWKLSANLGRRYAKVSGDFNPIHLTKFSARLFGFKQHVIHGMWTKSYCISMLHQSRPSLFLQAFDIKITFLKPLYLPNQVGMMVEILDTANINKGQDFKVVGNKVNNQQPPLHLTGHIRAI